jgi:PIN domain nuclease of toxin-antitoxin system
MRLLLDTHIFIWYLDGNQRLSSGARDSIRNPNNEIYLSVVSVWEAIVKYQLGKLTLPEPPSVFLPLQRQRHKIASLPLDEISVVKLAELPEIHKDPFDRMLICQALTYDLTLVTVDPILQAYPVSVFEHV